MIHANPELDTAEADAMRFAFLDGLGQKEKASAVRRDFLARTDAGSSLDRIQAALGLLSQGDFSAADRAQIKALVPAFATAAARSPNAVTADEYAYYPVMPFQDGSEAAKLPPAEFADLVAGLVPIWYPLTPTTTAASSSAGRPSGLEENTLPPTRFFDRNTFQAIQGVAQSLHQGDAARLNALLARLDEQARNLPPERRIFPALVAVYFQGLAGDSAAAGAALPRAQALLSAAPDDNDLRLLTGVLLAHSEHHAEALAMLNTVDVSRTGESPFYFQHFILTESEAAKDTESAKRAALRLVAMRVPPEQRESLSNELRGLGLTEQADALAHASASTTASSSSSGRQHSIFDSETAARLEQFVQEKNEDGALSLARSVLAALPPPPPNPYGNNSGGEYVLRTTLDTLKKLKKTDEFIADAEKQLAKDPDSLSLNYQLAVLSQQTGALVTAPRQPTATRKTPLWLKLARLDTGEVAGFWSVDGQEWKEIARARVPLGDAPLAVLSAATPRTPTASLVADHVTLAPPPADPAGPAPVGSSLPSPWTETQLPDDEPPTNPAPPPASWNDGTFTLHAGDWTPANRPAPPSGRMVAASFINRSARPTNWRPASSS